MKKGFTLIELLVVVLIIGVLAAVALPKYQLAVDKTKFFSAMPLLDALASAQERYYLANGQYAPSFDKLDLAFPAGDCKPGDYCCYVGGSGYCIGERWIYAEPWSNHEVRYFRTYDHSVSLPRRRVCDVTGNSARWKALCGGIGKKTSDVFYHSDEAWDLY